MPNLLSFTLSLKSQSQGLHPHYLDLLPKDYLEDPTKKQLKEILRDRLLSLPEERLLLLEISLQGEVYLQNQEIMILIKRSIHHLWQMSRKLDLQTQACIKLMKTN